MVRKHTCISRSSNVSFIKQRCLSHVQFVVLGEARNVFLKLVCRVEIRIGIEFLATHSDETL